MTIKYALTRTEILLFFLKSLTKSPKLLMIFMSLLLWPSLFYLWTTWSIEREISLSNAATAGGLLLAAACFLLAWIFVRGKTNERTLDVSEKGISTQIGKLKGQVAWAKVKLVTNAGRYVLIVRNNGNAFFIPSRAFTGPEEQARFVDEIHLRRKTF